MWFRTTEETTSVTSSLLQNSKPHDRETLAVPLTPGRPQTAPIKKNNLKMGPLATQRWIKVLTNDEILLYRGSHAEHNIRKHRNRHQSSTDSKCSCSQRNRFWTQPWSSFSHWVPSMSRTANVEQLPQLDTTAPLNIPSPVMQFKNTT